MSFVGSEPGPNYQPAFITKLHLILKTVVPELEDFLDRLDVRVHLSAETEPVTEVKGITPRESSDLEEVSVGESGRARVAHIQPYFVGARHLRTAMGQLSLKADSSPKSGTETVSATAPEAPLERPSHCKYLDMLTSGWCL